MSRLLTALHSIRRPQTLMRAARYGLYEYNRERDLKRLTREPKAPSPQKALTSLMAIEETLESNRLEGYGTYSVARHIEVLAAIMGEIRLLPETQSN
ncbi:MAG: DUF6477 family protein [Dinoroseobacter sp.]|nr:DUF6477 family protein [Dinoroseobacter sp.]MDJ0993923.1 DUF6477 family protein [Dinoroseobacter sp.]